MAISIARFDPACVQAGSTSLCVGDKCTGKSTLLRSLARGLVARAPAASVIAMSPLPSSQRELADCCHPMCVHDLRQDRLRDAVSRAKQSAAAGPPPHLLVILDDVTDQVLAWDAVRDMMTDGRALNITLLMAAQRLTAVKPDVRANLDFVFAFARVNCKAVHPFFAHTLPLPAFKKVVAVGTRNYECLVANAAVGQVQYYRAQNTQDNTNLLPREAMYMLKFQAKLAAHGDAMAQLKALTPQQVGLWFSVAAEYGHVRALQELARWHTVEADQVAAAAARAACKGRVEVLRYMVDTFGAGALGVPQAYAAALLAGRPDTAQFLLDVLRLTPEDILPVTAPPPRVACSEWQTALMCVRALS